MIDAAAWYREIGLRAWHFTERREEMDLFGDLSRHLLLPYGPEQARP